MKRLGPIAFGSQIDVPESRRVKQIREILESYHVYFFGGLIDRAKVFRKINLREIISFAKSPQ
jgi:hypothetical protein